MKLTINSQTKTSLREYLVREGYSFPCGGKGLCGRCKIIAPTLTETPLDLRFLSENERADGVRLACDKYFEGELTIDCTLAKASTITKIDEPLVFSILNDQNTIIGIADGDTLVETLVLPAPDVNTRDLRAVVGKNAIELYEKYNVAKANVLLISGTPERVFAITELREFSTYGESYDASELMLPAEEVFVLPTPNETIGSNLILNLLDREEGSLIIDGSTYSLIKDNSVFVARVTSESTELGLIAHEATIAYFNSEFGVKEVLSVNKNIPLATPILSQAEEVALRALAFPRVRTAINKLARKIVVLDLANDAIWQDLFSEISHKD